MSNHYHVVLRVDIEAAESLTDMEVVGRWHRLFKGNLFSQRFSKCEALTAVELDTLQPFIVEWRSRLADISWFMRLMNESIARKANKEDKCTGRLWEGRFKSQALLDEKALAACMAYVDLNPIRAKMANTPESSDHTSIQVRARKAKKSNNPNHRYQQPKNLLPFAGNEREDMPKGLPFVCAEYLALVDLTGRIMREDKRGFIDNTLPPLLERLNISPENWLTLTQQFEGRFSRWVGAVNVVERCKSHLKLTRVGNVRQCQVLFN